MIEHAYIHIPFCIRKCNYCSFVSGENIAKKEQYINALLKEIKKRYEKDKLKTIYIGGGTPSLLNIEDADSLLSLFNYEKNAEITMEVNPETVYSDKFTGFKKCGVNRISLGVQTFNNRLLQLIGRKHTSEDIYRAVEIIKNAGFENISIDLIYGLPEQSLNDFIEDIEAALSLDVVHISSYGLKIEEGSFFYNNTPKKLPDDEKQAEMYLKLCEILKKHNYNHYEISNFAKEGCESRHNKAYWLNKQYYGFGMNASGYEKNLRYKNISNFEQYIINPVSHEEEDILTTKETKENEIFLALRLAEGLNIKEFNKKYSCDFRKEYRNIIEKYIKSDLIDVSEDKINLTEKGFLLSNEIMSEFL